MTISGKISKNSACPRCGSTGKFKQIQYRIYTPPMTKQKLITQIDRCLGCNEMVGSILKHQAREGCEEDV
jgi:hypothetical protein